MTGSPYLDSVRRLLPAETHGADETRDLGRQIGSVLGGPAVLALFGSLGAGKTQLTKGIADGIGLDGDLVTSPTFTLVHTLRTPGREFIHVDAYRIRSARELMDLDLDHVLYGDAVSVIEWPERLADLLPVDTISICLEHGAGDSRRIRLDES